MTNEECEAFKRATDPLKPLAASGYFAGIEGLTCGFAAIVAYALANYFGAAEVVAAGLGLAASFVVGGSFGKDKWRRYHAACDAEIEAMRRGRGNIDA